MSTFLNLRLISLFVRVADGRKLGIARIFFFFGILILVSQWPTEQFVHSARFMWEPQSLYSLFGIDLPRYKEVQLLRYLWMVLLFTSMIGLATRVSMLFCFLLGLLIWSIPVGFVTSAFYYYLPTVVLGIFAFSKAGDHLSVDFLLKRKKPDLVNEDYGWPLRLILFNVATMYGAAAASKLRYSGFDWIFGDILLTHLKLARESFASNSFDWMTVVADWLFANPLLVNFIAAGVVIFEATSIVAFFSRRAFVVYFPLWISFHIAIGLFAGIRTGYFYIPVFAALLPLYYRARHV